MLHWLILLALAAPAANHDSQHHGATLTGRDKHLLAQSSREQATAKKVEGDNLLKAGDKKKAEAAYRQAIQLDPGWYASHEALGNLFFSDKRFSDAIEAFMKAVEVEPRYHTGLYNIAFAYRKSQNYKKAAEYYHKYIERQPQDPDAYYGLAASLEALGDKQAAIQQYLKYAEKETRPSEKKYVIKARQKADELKAELAVASPTPAPAPQTAPASQPTTPTTPRPKTEAPRTESKVTTLLQDGDQALQASSYSKAMKKYFEAAQIEPRNTDALYKLGRVYLLTGNEKAARMKWQAVLQIDGQHAEAKKALADLDARQKTKPSTKGSPPEAGTTPKAQPAGASPVSQSDKIRKRLQEGDAFFKQKSFSRAIVAYTEAAKLDAASEEALFKLGVAYAMAGNLKVAIFKWEKVLKINPGNQSARRNIQRAKAKMGVDTGTKKTPEKPAESAKATPKMEPSANDKPKPGTYDAFMALALNLKEKGNPEGVLDAIDKAIHIKPTVEALLLKGEALVVLKRYSDAKRIFSKAMVLDPNRAAPLYGLAEASRLAGDKDRAQYYFKLYVQSKAADKSEALQERARKYLAGS